MVAGQRAVEFQLTVFDGSGAVTQLVLDLAPPAADLGPGAGAARLVHPGSRPLRAALSRRRAFVEDADTRVQAVALLAEFDAPARQVLDPTPPPGTDGPL